MVVVVMGVAGSGKTTVGRALAASLRWPFYDADDFHSDHNVEKMRRGVALSDGDREPWLQSLRELVRSVGDGDAVLACSSLRRVFRQQLAAAAHDLRFVYLKASRDLLVKRLSERDGHFMPVSLLDSQLGALEEPRDAVVVDAAVGVSEAVALISSALDGVDR
jgi:gluconokinase